MKQVVFVQTNLTSVHLRGYDELGTLTLNV